MKDVLLHKVIIVLLIPFIGFTQADSKLITEINSIQKGIVSKLTGTKPIKDSIFLKQRASPSERKIVVSYLSDYLSELGLKIDNYYYKTSNGNAFLDLFFSPNEGVNVVGILPATSNSEDYVIFGAHYDSERGSPGAIDNATGVALSLTLAYKLSQLKERNINFMIVLFDQEEDGALGSKAFAKKLKNENVNVHSVHTIDMVGWDDNKNRALEIQLPNFYLETLYKKVSEDYNSTIHIVNYASSDYESFLDLNFTTVGVSEECTKGDTTPFYHKSTDTYDTVNFDYLSFSTHFMYSVMLSILNETQNDKN